MPDPSQPDPSQIAAEQKAALLARERAHAGSLVDAYGAAYQRLRARLDTLTRFLGAQRAAGQVITKPALLRETRYQEMLVQVNSELGRFAANAGAAITSQQQFAVQQAAQDAARLTVTSLGPASSAATVIGSFRTVPSPAAQQLVGMLGDGQPLSTLLSEIAPQAVDAVKKTLVTGLLAGDGPRKIGAQVRDDLGVGLTRALAISRTSVMTAYRGAALDIYQQNDDVVSAWRWSASHTDRTCAMCLAMSGREFPLDVPFASHVCCRCVPVPVTATWEELGIDVPDTRPPMQTGEEWFAAQPAGVQKGILGPAKFKAYQAGQFTLPDLVGYRDDPRWGPTRWERSLKDVQTVQNHGRGGISNAASAAAPALVPTPPAAPGTGAGGSGGNGSGGNTPGGNLLVPPNDDWRERVKDYRLPELQQYALRHHTTVDDYLVQADAHTARLVKSLKPMIRVDEDVLVSILDDGRWKSQFETGTSNGAFAPSMRKMVEQELFGIDRALPDPVRPIYGFLHTSTAGSLREDNWRIDQYGSIAVRLKPSVRRCTSFCGGDSLDETEAAALPVLCPSPLLEPSCLAFTPTLGDIMQYRSARALLSATTNPDIGYLEAQFFEQVTTDDIEEVTFYQSPPTASLKAALRAHSVHWRVVQ